MKVLVTGANGFIGSHLCERLRLSEHQVRAMVRSTSDLRWISDLNLDLAYADLRDRDNLWVAVQGVEGVLHVGGALRARDTADFERVNHEGTQLLVDMCIRAAVKRFVLFSSAAAAGPASGPDDPLTESQECRPVSLYGEAKLRAEQAVLAVKEKLHSVILRFPAVYGPRDRDGLVLWRNVKAGLLPVFGETFSVVHVADAVQAAVLALEKDVPSGSVYFISDGESHTYERMAELAERLLGRRPVSLKLPTWLFSTVASFAEVLSREGSTFSRDKVRQLGQGSWVCSPAKAQAELGFRPDYGLERGLKQTLEWYEREGWL